jgi:DNA-binding PadR family transcriptional regulator
MPGDRGSPRKYYRLTPSGRKFLERRVVEWRRVTALLGRTVFD